MHKRVAIFILMIWPLAVAAQGGETLEFEIRVNEALTTQDVVGAALDNSPDQLVVGSKEQYAKALSGQASSLFADTPEISVRLQNDRLFSNQGLREWESSLDIPLWMPGQKSASRQKARMSDREARAYQNLALLNVTGLVREMLWEIKLATAALGRARDNLQISEDLGNDISKKIEAGNLPRQNSILAQKDIMTRKIELIKAEAEYIHAGREYESITGLTEMPAYFEEAVDHGADMVNVPILELYRAKVDGLEAEYNIRRKSWGKAPTLSIGVKRETASFMDQNIDSVGVGLSVPLGASAHVKSKRAEAALALAEMEREQALVNREYKLSLHEAEHELEVCEVQLPLSASHFKMSQENLRLAQKAFDMGETDLFDLLKIQEQFFSSSAENTQIIIECKRAIARHNQVKGVLLP